MKNKDEIKGKIKKAEGKIIEEIGEATGNKKQQIKGKLKQTEGKAQEEIGKIKKKVNK